MAKPHSGKRWTLPTPKITPLPCFASAAWCRWRSGAAGGGEVLAPRGAAPVAGSRARDSAACVGWFLIPPEVSLPGKRGGCAGTRGLRWPRGVKAKVCRRNGCGVGQPEHRAAVVEASGTG